MTTTARAPPARPRRALPGAAVPRSQPMNQSIYQRKWEFMSTQSERQGTIRSFNTDRGFGFITPTDGTEDVFVHVSRIAGTATNIEPGREVTFTSEPGPQGPRAKKVWLL